MSGPEMVEFPRYHTLSDGATAFANGAFLVASMAEEYASRFSPGEVSIVQIGWFHIVYQREDDDVLAPTAEVEVGR